MVCHDGDHETNAGVKKEYEMSLIDRYVAEVGRHLPEKDRADIEAEIRSMVEDMLEERGNQPTSADDKAIGETLEQLGDPTLLASNYAPPRRYLIGPDWYEIYIKSLQRVLFTALPIVAAVTFILTLTENPLNFIDAVGEALGSAFNVGVQIWFWMTLVFVLLDRSDTKPDQYPRTDPGPWTVARLPEMPTKRQISSFETIMNIAAILFVMIWIVLPLVLNVLQGESIPIPFLHPNLSTVWLPVFFVLMGLTVVLEAFKLKVGMWTPALTIANVILCVISIVYLAALVTTQEVINPEFLAMLDQSGGQNLREAVMWSIKISAAIIACTYVWSIVDSIRLSRQLKQRS
jgi:hypothetical protein